MKIRDLEPNYRWVENGMSQEEAYEKLLQGKLLKASSLNELLYYFGFLDEDAICTSVQCQDCPFLEYGYSCIVNSSEYVRDLITSKLT